MGGIFLGATSFNSNISNWNISSVTNTNGTFDGASSFNQNLCPWGPKLPSSFDYATDAVRIFVNSGCSNKTSPLGPTGPWCAVTNCTAWMMTSVLSNVRGCWGFLR
jgi:hypothetical protein